MASLNPFNLSPYSGAYAASSSSSTTDSSINSRNTSTSNISTPVDLSGSAQDALNEELPPAYTATPDYSQGESTVEYGPSRPFQPAPPRGGGSGRPLGTYQAPRASIWHRPQPSGWQSSWSGYPGQLQRNLTTVGDRAPPPRHPSQSSSQEFFPNFSTSHSNLHSTPSAAPLPPSPQTAAATSDFARDFYASASNDTGLLGGAPYQYEAPASAVGPTNSAESPRPATPPRLDGGPSNNLGTPNSASQSDDGRPTTTPVPGHPLMHNGRVLVYPAGHECSKCLNTGYKHFDPSHPCSKCWQKYAKPFSGPIAYAPWSSTPGDTATRGNLNLQRPLRILATPAGHRYSSSLSKANYPPPAVRSQLARSTSLTHLPGHAGASYAQSNFMPLAGGGGFPLGPQDSSLYSGPSAQYRHGGPPPPGALVVTPGDPRMGGRLCWRCSGSGTVSLFFFDQSTCEVCDGVGRIFR